MKKRPGSYPNPVMPTEIGRLALKPHPMSPPEIRALVKRVRVNMLAATERAIAGRYRAAR